MRKLAAALPPFVALALCTLPAGAADPSYATLQRGKYLVDAGDCVACHTAEKSKPFAGGRAIPTPFGTIFSANITPDRDTGIGAWSADDFYRAMHAGRDPHGDRLYPAFPYPYFTKMTRADVDAVRAFLMTLEPIRNSPPGNRLPWPLDERLLMAGWNRLFFTKGEFRSDPARSAEWNRGAYLVEGAGHCGACHTPKNVFGADEDGQRLAGARIQDWIAPSLRADQRDGLGAWSAADVAEYLKTGRNRFSGATGLMAEVVVNSTSKMTDADLKAIATYLKDLPAKGEPRSATPAAEMMKAGEAIYVDTCAACHQRSGEGVAHMFPQLKGDPTVQQSDPSTVIRVILEGARTAATDRRPTPSAMPAFGWKLDDRKVAAVATYVRNAWGNKAPPVGDGAVADMRKAISGAKAGPETIGGGARPAEQKSG